MEKGVRVEGVLSAINSFAGKLSGGIAAGGVGLLMGICGFDGTLAVQSSTAMGSIVALYCWIPAVLYAFLILFIRLFDLDKKSQKSVKNWKKGERLQYNKRIIFKEALLGSEEFWAGLFVLNKASKCDRMK